MYELKIPTMSHSHYIKKGNTFTVIADGALDIHDSLPARNYTVKLDPMTGFYLQEIEDFASTGKKYGNINRNRDRIISTFLSRPAATGAIFSGEKGSGKSLLAKEICIEGVKQGIPVVVINTPHKGENFNTFIQSMDQPTIILFDEFEKIYTEEDQVEVLTLLDGVYPSKKLFVITCNDKWRIDSHMRNRPGRIFYAIDFKGLSQEFIGEYCRDNLNNKTYIDRICALTSIFSQFNFDMLKALVEEMNRYNETPEQALSILNIRPEYDSSQVVYDIKLTVGGVEIPIEAMNNSTFKGNPLQGGKDNDGEICVPYRTCNDKPATVKDIQEDKGDLEWNYSYFDTKTDVKNVDPKNGTFTLVNGSGDVVILTKAAQRERSDWYAF